MKKDLTQLEILCLPEKYNLTDGQAHRPLSKDEQSIINDMPQIFMEANREQQTDYEQAYISAFYGLTGQTINPQKTKYLLLPSGSTGIGMVASYLARSHIDVALIEPSIDIIVSIFTRYGVALEPLQDSWLRSSEQLNERLGTLHSKAIFLVAPNNPTGIRYTIDSFKVLLKFCKQYHKLLIIDASFRLFIPPEQQFDEYKLLQESGIDYIVIEDTGKMWPTKQMKVSILASSPAMYDQLYGCYTDFVYHHSPFMVTLLTRFVQKAADDNLQGALEPVRLNRKALYTVLTDTFLRPTEALPLGFAWLEIAGGRTADEVVAAAAKEEVFILPGTHFFWANKAVGHNYVRVALLRDPVIFQEAAERLRKALRSLA